VSTSECVQRRKEGGLDIAFGVGLSLGCSTRVKGSELRLGVVRQTEALRQRPVIVAYRTDLGQTVSLLEERTEDLLSLTFQGKYR
jgi:hypothetical protein